MSATPTLIPHPEESHSTSRSGGRGPWAGIGLCVALYFVTRMWGLNVLPIFLDEAVHLQWAERLFGEGRILRPIGSGRLLAIAAYGLALPFEDRLFAARAIAAFAGVLTLVFTMLLSRRLFGARASLVAGALYILSPFALTYDRLALSDGFLSACLTGLMLATERLSRRPDEMSPRGVVAILMILAVTAKVSAALFFFAIPLGALALASRRWDAFRSASLATILGLAGASPMLGFFAANGGEVFSQHVAAVPFVGSVASTVLDMRAWAVSYFTIPTLLFAAASFALLRDGRALWLFGSLALPFVFFALFSQPWSARYVLPTLPPLLILVSGGIETLISRCRPSLRSAAALLFTTLAASSFFSFDRHLILNPALAPFPDDDRRQLVTGWPSGYGVRELSQRLLSEASAGPLTVFVDTGGTRTISTSLPILVGRRSSIQIIEGDFGSAPFRASMTPSIETRRAFAVIGPRGSDFDFKTQMGGGTVERVEVFTRPGGEWAASLFRLGGEGKPAEPSTNGSLF